ncbi:uncharacterized protein LOC119451019 isoform X2 [Dermacentor silvarum]|uniref:uncharacterized protein LOC119451019 isoform X2 n=1 Tax=Dermacentor silvarum TaxID=543639 RepID=UPI0021016B27|nr:uncharacterized protein LOC119451019 isoform X2 [Dermacentor silvarum]
MELRVWLEGGPQRVVCGVTEATTCQDVVYALAQATAQTGRFALVERSRRSERPLAPSDRPLRLLARWGRCASDVHFLLRRCGPTSTGPKAGSTPRGVAAAVQAPSERPRRPPPYDEAVTRLAAGAHHFPRSKEPLQGLGESPSKQQQPDDDYSELLRVVSLQRERLHNTHEEVAQKDAAFGGEMLSRWGRWRRAVGAAVRASAHGGSAERGTARGEPGGACVGRCRPQALARGLWWLFQSTWEHAQDCWLPAAAGKCSAHKQESQWCLGLTQACSSANSTVALSTRTKCVILEAKPNMEAALQ